MNSVGKILYRMTLGEIGGKDKVNDKRQKIVCQ